MAPQSYNLRFEYLFACTQWSFCYLIWKLNKKRGKLKKQNISYFWRRGLMRLHYFLGVYLYSSSSSLSLFFFSSLVDGSAPPPSFLALLDFPGPWGPGRRRSPLCLLPRSSRLGTAWCCNVAWDRKENIHISHALCCVPKPSFKYDSLIIRLPSQET